MDLHEALDFLRANHRSVLVTRKQNGDPQMSPVVHGVDGEGRIAISTREPAYKVRNLRRDPRASLLGLNDGFFGRWVQVDGTVELISLPEAMEPLVDLYRQIAGEHPGLGRLPGRHGARAAVDRGADPDVSRTEPGRMTRPARPAGRPAHTVAPGVSLARPHPGPRCPGDPGPAGARAGVERPAVGRRGHPPGRPPAIRWPPSTSGATASPTNPTAATTSPP